MILFFQQKFQALYFFKTENSNISRFLPADKTTFTSYFCILLADNYKVK